MWTIWVIAYVTGTPGTSSISAYGRAAARVLSVPADQQLAVGIMWAVSAICFLPAIYALVITWIGEHWRPDEESRAARSPGSFSGLGPRPPRGWRSPPD